jgi:Sulfotransferase family
MSGEAAGGSLPTVLYLVGCGRSGSTLVERMLGAIPGYHNVGELARLFPSVATQDQRCGCGVVFSECPFWQAVGDKAFGGWDPALIARLRTLQSRLTRHRFAPALVAPRAASEQFRTDLDEYTQAYRALYAAIGEVSGARVLVDASKSPTHLLAMRRIAGLDLRVLNIVRDARGVAHSWSKVGVRKPHDEAGAQTMRTYAPRRTALIWSMIQAEAGLLRRAADHGARIRYEDVVAEPRAVLEQALAVLELDVPVGAFDHVQGRSVALGASHGISGNPSRFEAGSVELRQDLGWQADMTRQDRRAVTARAFPLLVAYGYVTRSARGADAQGVNAVGGQ